MVQGYSILTTVQWPIVHPLGQPANWKPLDIEQLRVRSAVRLWVVLFRCCCGDCGGIFFLLWRVGIIQTCDEYDPSVTLSLLETTHELIVFPTYCTAINHE